MVEQLNCPGYSDCSIDTHLILVRWADYRVLKIALEHVRSSAQTGTSESGVVISYAAFEHVKKALASAEIESSPEGKTGDAK